MHLVHIGCAPSLEPPDFYRTLVEVFYKCAVEVWRFETTVLLPEASFRGAGGGAVAPPPQGKRKKEKKKEKKKKEEKKRKKEKNKERNYE